MRLSPLVNHISCVLASVVTQMNVSLPVSCLNPHGVRSHVGAMRALCPARQVHKTCGQTHADILIFMDISHTFMLHNDEESSI